MTSRIYVGADVDALVPGAEYALPPPAVRHVAQVLRMRAGEPLTLFTGAGGEYATTITRIGRAGVLLRIERHDPIERESPWPVTLVQSLIAADTMDWTVRKAVELGVAAVRPVRSERSQAVPSARAERRVEHWRQVAIAACEQCGRNRVPDIGAVTDFAHWLESRESPLPAVLLDGDAGRSLAAQVASASPRAVLVGPEGGFTPDEIARAIASGATPVHLGRRVLRAETAALAALVTVGAIAGDAR